MKDPSTRETVGEECFQASARRCREESRNLGAAAFNECVGRPGSTVCVAPALPPEGATVDY